MDKIFSDAYKSQIIRDRYILLIDNKGNRRFVTVNVGQVNLSKHHKINLNFFEKKSLNSFWEYDESAAEFKEITSRDFFDEDMVEGNNLDYDNKNIVGNSNKEIYSTGEAQKLTEKQIKELKDQGLTGEEIIKKVIENNSSMDKRTLLSQEKILKKKEKVHKYKLWISPTSLLNLAETMFMDNPKYINFLRMDSISTILSYANLIGKANSLIFEDSHGLLTSAFAQRSSIHSNIVSLFQKRIKTRFLNHLYMKKRDKYPITHLKIDNLIAKDTFNGKLFQKLYTGYFENLVICLKEEKETLKYVGLLYPFIKLCGMIIIFSKELEVLIAIEKSLFEAKMALDIKIHETIVREFQILPLRTHPQMNNKGYSGYVLTAIKINEI